MGFIRLALISIFILFSIFLTMDWYSILVENTRNQYSFLIKYCITLTCVMVAWKAQSRSISPIDDWLLRFAFLFVALADFFLVILCGFIDNSRLIPVFFAIGIVGFAIFQVLMIIRHAVAIFGRVELFSPAISKEGILRVFTTLLLFITGLVASVLYWPHIAGLGSLATMGLVYAFLLSISVWIAWGAAIGSVYPRINSLMIAIGMTLFLFCDLCVGIEMFFKNTIANVASGLVWLFYTPALLLLALSGYHNIKEKGNLS